jgi:dimethylglycine dehydrogenase
MGYVRSEWADRVDGFEVELLGLRRDAVRLPEPLFDPDGSRMRG